MLSDNQETIPSAVLSPVKSMGLALSLALKNLMVGNPVTSTPLTSF